MNELLLQSAPAVAEPAREAPVPAARLSEAELRDRIRREIPHSLVRAPMRAWAMVPLFGIAVLGTWAIIAYELPWYAMAAIALVIGNNYGAGMLLGHECLHGSVVRQRWLQDLLGYLGLGPLVMSPTLWRVWHNIIHHGKTNNPMLDTDHFGTLRRYKQMKST